MPTKTKKRKRPSALPASKTPEILDVRMTAQFLTISPDMVYALFQRGEVLSRKVGRKWITTKAMVLRWLEHSTQGDTLARQNHALARAIEGGNRTTLFEAMNTGKVRARP